MLACPQCEYDNPNDSQSCQRCGVSLSHKACSECGTFVSFEEETCPCCGTFTATAWLAVIADNQFLDPSSNSALKTIEKEYLDPGQRYRLITPRPHEGHSLLSPPAISGDNDLNIQVEAVDRHLRFQGRVVDCQPLQKSVLKTLLEQQEAWLNDDDNPLHGTKEIRAFLWRQMGIPELAFPYLSLSEFCPLIPEIHDAWHDGSQEIILLTDRSSWQLLKELCAVEELATLQIVYWLDKMASLWIPLSEVHCCQSLLIEDNLRVDEDQTFALVQLYDDPRDRQPTLKDLGRMWQHLLGCGTTSALHQSNQQNIDALKQLFEQLISEQINTVSQLRLQLQNLGQQQQVRPQGVEVVELFTNSESAPPSIREISLSAEGTHPHDLSISSTYPVTEASNSENVDWGRELVPDTMLLPIKFDQNNDQLDTGTEDETIIEGSFCEESPTADLPMKLLSLTDAGHTDIGRLRRHNEDYFGVETQIKKQQSNRGQNLQARGLYIVCDGMGGHASGEIASAMAVETLQRYFATHWQNELPDAKTLEQAILLANETIYQVNQDKDSYGCGRMGTTLVMVLLEGTKIAIAHVGDSRIYQVNRKWGLEQLTVDHEVGQRVITQGVDPIIAYSRSDAYQLTQALGPHDNQYVKPDIKYLDLHEDTLLLLCSDGLSDNKFLETHYSTCLTPLISSSANLDEGIQKLFALANEKNGHDNITAILVRIKLQPYFEQPL